MLHPFTNKAWLPGLPTVLGTWIVAWVVAAACSPAAAQEEPGEQLPKGEASSSGTRAVLPEGDGLAAAHPGDQGLAADPRVVFFEDFEERSLEELFARWESVSEPQIMSLSSERPEASAGRQSLEMTHVGGEGTGGHLYRRLEPGYEKLFVRFYVRFDPDSAPIHHFFHIGGYNPSTPYPQGGAGQRPKGNERFTVGIEPFGEDWRWDYYAYWRDMGASPPRGQTWGNSFIRDPALKAVRGQWMCCETMIKLNDIGQANGELALWVDGKRVSHVGPGFPRGKWIYDKFFPGQGGEAIRWNEATRRGETYTVAQGGEPFEGFRWRDDDDLKINFLWVLYYMTRAESGHKSRVWFDQIVAATDYIGPIKPAE